MRFHGEEGMVGKIAWFSFMIFIYGNTDSVSQVL